MLKTVTNSKPQNSINFKVSCSLAEVDHINKTPLSYNKLYIGNKHNYL